MTYTLRALISGTWPPGLGWTPDEVRTVADCWEPDAHLPIPPWLVPADDSPPPTPAPEPEE